MFSLNLKGRNTFGEIVKGCGKGNNYYIFGKFYTGKSGVKKTR